MPPAPIRWNARSTMLDRCQSNSAALVEAIEVVADGDESVLTMVISKVERKRAKHILKMVRQTRL